MQHDGDENKTRMMAPLYPTKLFINLENLNKILQDLKIGTNQAKIKAYEATYKKL